MSEENGTFFASFQPDEAGEWKIHVTYDERDIENSPFRCMAFDPRAVFVSATQSVNYVNVLPKYFSFKNTIKFRRIHGSFLPLNVHLSS